MLYNRNSHHDPKRRLKNEGLRNVAELRTRPRYAPLAEKLIREPERMDHHQEAESYSQFAS